MPATTEPAANRQPATARHLPPPLRPGDTIGVFAPAGPVQDRDAAEAGLRLLNEAGFVIRHRRGLLERRRGYLAGEDRERVEELHELWRDPEVKALLALRGGYGCLRLLPLLNWELLAARRKLLIGFSDLTVLQSALLQKTGTCPLHGPMLSTLATSDRESVRHFFQVIGGDYCRPIRPAGLEIIRPGQARGPLLGGNLACLNHLLGTPWEPDLRGSILLLEDVGEAPYRIDRLLTQLALAGRLTGLAGLILGEFQDCGPQEDIWQLLLELTAAQQLPIWGNFPVGHGRRNLTLPLGATASLDSSRGELIFT
ncbi:S66 peptidase family protein [Desulfurivibrio alkaliphilus]|uniref:Muramoyltetrapeptide carboxypeptidase n=1 Tax=Desulfurivibrio alkaliphilus (strain DSM 19089 / UNIQEM U267 / AHT2) TaxID=589865 RepID=D6Z6Q4_DESAT|nr:LD-carboxypeptidase [Desulfurivibrio alkaliphilus]ADH85013.1 Muramoyltetrapeptide carboxypeptidase [Desulfurivibrio alkaliphilus AHT 2]